MMRYISRDIYIGDFFTGSKFGKVASAFKFPVVTRTNVKVTDSWFLIHPYFVCNTCNVPTVAFYDKLGPVFVMNEDVESY